MAVINFNGWLGEGYVITDPITGDAAYKISGGGNGGLLSMIRGYFSYMYTWYLLNYSVVRGSPVWFAVKGLVKIFGIGVALLASIETFFSECQTVSGALAMSFLFSGIAALLAILLFFASIVVVIAISIAAAVGEHFLQEYLIEEVGC